MPFFGGGGSGGTGDYVITGTNIDGGTNAMPAVVGDNNMALGNAALQLLTTGDRNIVIGNLAANIITTDNYNVVIGYFSGGNAELISRSVIIGDNAANNDGYPADTSHISSSVIIGNEAFTPSTATGMISSGDVLIGTRAGNALLQSGSSVFIGIEANSRNSESYSGIAIGPYALVNENSCIAIGANAHAYHDPGFESTIAIGKAAHSDAVTSNGAISIGNNTSSTDSGIAIGESSSAGANAIAIGNAVSALDNEIVIGDSTQKRVRIGQINLEPKVGYTAFEVGNYSDNLAVYISLGNFPSNTAIASIGLSPDNYYPGKAGCCEIYAATPLADNATPNGGDIFIQAGHGRASDNGNGGDTYIAAARGGGSGASGKIRLIKADYSTDVITINNTGIGFFNTTPIAKPSITGSRGGNAALASLLTQLANFGLITDATTA